MSLTINVSDNLNNWGDNLGRSSAWELKFGEKLTITDKLFADFLLTIAQSDDLSNWADTAIITEKGLYKLDEGDNLDNLTDALTKIVGHQLNLGDAIVGHADKVSIILQLRKILSDNLNNWSDSANIVASLVSHSIIESDNLKFLVDSVNLLFGYRVTALDNLDNWKDSLNIVQLTDLTQDLSDNLDNWGDAVAVSLTIRGETAIKNTIVDYLRKYLNE